MDQVFFYAAVIGGTLLVAQTVMMFLGAGGDVELEIGDDAGIGDAAQLTILKLLSFQGVVAFLTFFGLSGMIARSSEFEVGSSSTIGVLAGAAAMFMVVWMMSSLAKLHSDGSLKLRNAVGAGGRVYLRVPAAGATGGRVLVNVQGRRIECKAITAGEELSVGVEIEVVRLVGADVLEVRARS